MERIKFEDLKGEAKEFEFRGKKIRIPPLTVDDFDVFIKIRSNDIEERKQGLVELFVRTMKLTFPGIDENEIKKIPSVIALELYPLILIANGLVKDENEIKKMMEEVDIEDFQISKTD